MTPAEILAMVSEACGVSVQEIQSRRKRDEVVFARYITVMLLKEEGFCNKDMLQLFPLHDRTTILYNSVDAFNELIDYHPHFRALYKRSLKLLLKATGEL